MGFWDFVSGKSRKEAKQQQTLEQLRACPLYKVLRRREIDPERRREIQREWHRFCAGQSRYQPFIEKLFQLNSYSLPLGVYGLEKLGQKRDKKKEAEEGWNSGGIDTLLAFGAALSIGPDAEMVAQWEEIGRRDLVRDVTDITPERLRLDEELFVCFVDYHYEDLTRWVRDAGGAQDPQRPPSEEAKLLSELDKQLSELLGGENLPPGPTRDRVLKTTEEVKYQLVMSSIREKFGPDGLKNPAVRAVLEKRGWKFEEFN